MSRKDYLRREIPVETRGGEKECFVKIKTQECILSQKMLESTKVVTQKKKKKDNLVSNMSHSSPQ